MVNCDKLSSRWSLGLKTIQVITKIVMGMEGKIGMLNTKSQWQA